MSGAFAISQPELRRSVAGNAVWEGRVDSAFQTHSQVSAHLAVMREPYLSYVLKGRKTIESRFSRTHVPPYGCVDAGDVLLLKEVGGPVVGLAEVASAHCYLLDRAIFARLQQQFAAALCITDPQFWEDRRDARFATLMRLRDVVPIEPLAIEKRDRRGWVMLTSLGVHRDQLGLDLGTGPPAPARLVSEPSTDDDPVVGPPDQLQLFAGGT